MKHLPEDLISSTVSFVQEALKGAEGGHDWFHTERVWKMARYIREKEQQGDLMVIELAALLHDIADPKFHDGDQEKGARLASGFLEKKGVDEERVRHVGEIIRNVSYKGGNPKDVATRGTATRSGIRSFEFRIVQDADRLDAMGAIGIARAFNYGGFKNRPIHDPSIPVREYNDPAAYYRSNAPTINHFYEKLLKLKDLMHTSTGRRIAGGRHRFMLEFLENFYREWDPDGLRTGSSG